MTKPKATKRKLPDYLMIAAIALGTYAVTRPIMSSLTFQRSPWQLVVAAALLLVCGLLLRRDHRRYDEAD